MLMLVLSAMLGLGTTLLGSIRRRFVAPLLMLACAGALITAAHTRQYDADLAAPTRMSYVNDAHSWKAWWVMPAAPRGAGGRPFVAATGGARELPNIYGTPRHLQWVAPAPREKIALPDIVVLKDDDNGTRRKISFTLRSQNKAPAIALRVEGAATLAARLDGSALGGNSAMRWSMNLYGAGGSAHTMELELASGSSARVYIEERIPGLPDNAGGARPDHMALTGMTVASDMLVFR
jgi:hypothetical protein